MAPNAPTNVTTSAGDGWVGASWSPATTMPDAPAITGYRVSAVDASGVQTSVNALCTTTACSATVPNLINGRAYTVEVRALSTAGASAAALAPTSVSPTGVVQPPVGATAPNAPTVLSASSGSPTGAINATVNWTAPAQPAGVTIDGWRVTAYDMSTATPSVIKRVFVDETAGTSSARSRTVAFATAGPVSFKVQAIAADEAGTLSALSVASTTVQAQ
jgi:hypothetical protein